MGNGESHQWKEGLRIIKVKEGSPASQLGTLA